MAKKELPILSANGQTPVKKPRLKYDCSKCVAYCCTYDWIRVSKADIQRLAKGFGLSYEEAERKFTKFVKEYDGGHRVLRHRTDSVYKSACRFLDQTERRCTIYEHRPSICREHPEEGRCGYYDFLMWEREHQDDPEFVPLQR